MLSNFYNYYSGSDSEICRFYENKSIFLTGATGFIGKFTLEKILRTCRGVNKIYVLVRNRKNKDFESRIRDLSSIPLFNGTKDVFAKKVIPIQGDLESPNVGLSEENQHVLRENVNVVFHCAATVRFDEVFKKALQYNVHATYEILEFCSTFKHLISIVHVSTAFSHAHKIKLEEKIYPGNANYEQIEEYLRMDDEYICSNQKGLMGEWTTSYAFSKAATERMIAEKYNHLPLSIFRPVIVNTPSEKHPVAGYLDNIYDGVAALATGVAYGVFRIIYLTEGAETNLVPVDYCTNAMMIIGYETSKEKDMTISEPKVYNYAPQGANMVSWSDFILECLEISYEIPLMNTVWYPKISITNNKLALTFFRILYHYMPALIVDSLLVISGKKAKIFSQYKKIHQLSETMVNFVMTKHDFPINNIMALNDKLSPIDRELFYVDMTTFNWNQYFYVFVRGLRKYLCKENDYTIPAARSKLKKLAALHYLILYGMLFSIFYVIWLCFKNILM